MINWLCRLMGIPRYNVHYRCPSKTVRGRAIEGVYGPMSKSSAHYIAAQMNVSWGQKHWVERAA